MGNDLARLNNQTAVLACTASSASKTLSEFNGTSTVNIYNAGPDDVFVKTSTVAETLVFPTTSTAQDGTILPAGAYVAAGKLAQHDRVHAICDTGNTATVYIQFNTGE